MQPFTKAALLAGCLSFCSCFTTLLWGGDPSPDDSDNVYAQPASYGDSELRRRGPERVGNELPLWQRLLLTPFAVGLDLLTLPIQGAAMGFDAIDEEF